MLTVSHLFGSRLENQQCHSMNPDEVNPHITYGGNQAKTLEDCMTECTNTGTCVAIEWHDMKGFGEAKDVPAPFTCKLCRGCDEKAPWNGGSVWEHRERSVSALYEPELSGKQCRGHLGVGTEDNPCKMNVNAGSQVTEAWCMMQCEDEPDFDCVAIEYREDDKRCNLCDSCVDLDNWGHGSVYKKKSD